MASNNLTRKQILDLFQMRLCEGYQEYCKMHELDSNFDGLITYIIDQELIPVTTIQKYTLLREFKDVLEKKQIQKTQTVENLAHRFNLSERTVWNILKNNNKK
jgi:hypothetical protein